MPVVLITGCSQGGIGYALAKEYAARGCQVVATARNPARMGGLEQLGCRLLPLDVADPDSVRELADTVAAEYGGVDVLVNNAGGAARGPVLDSPVPEAEALFQASVLSCTQTTCTHASYNMQHAHRQTTLARCG
jgi:NAD(P)-dependent dehydrogenase (short-subunit alcohol dehydrogenase family)